MGGLWSLRVVFEGCLERLLRGGFGPLGRLQHLLRGADYAELEQLVPERIAQMLVNYNIFAHPVAHDLFIHM